MILLPSVEVDRFFVHENQRAREINFTDDLWFAGDVDDHEIVAGNRPQANGVRGVSFVSPVIVLSREVEKSGRRKPRAQIGDIHIAEFFVWFNG